MTCTQCKKQLKPTDIFTTCNFIATDKYNWVTHILCKKCTDGLVEYLDRTAEVEDEINPWDSYEYEG